MLAERLVFTTKEIEITYQPEYLTTSQSSSVIISAYRKNFFGMKTPFAKGDYDFIIEQGGNLVEMNLLNQETTEIKSLGREGEIVVGIYDKANGSVVRRIVIKILPKPAA